MSRFELSTAMRMWSVYVMAAPAMKGLTYFKVGITSDIAKRVCGVQTGCPLRITRAWAINVLDNGHAQSVESAMHRKLQPFHSHGEWFAMETDNAAHKAAMNEAMAYGLGLAVGPHARKWRQIEIPDLKAAVREAANEVAANARSVRKRESRKALSQMATQGRRIL